MEEHVKRQVTTPTFVNVQRATREQTVKRRKQKRMVEGVDWVRAAQTSAPLFFFKKKSKSKKAYTFYILVPLKKQNKVS